MYKFPEKYKNQKNQFVYGTAERDEKLLKDGNALVRYAGLARKALSYYAGESYNPHLFAVEHEIVIRNIIAAHVETKVLSKHSDYDWVWIDNTLKYVIAGFLKIDLKYDQAILDRGPLPEFCVKETFNLSRPN